jgi:hypothetical protein
MARSGLADVLNLALERELGRLDADDDEPEVAVFVSLRAHEGQRAERVDAAARHQTRLAHDQPLRGLTTKVLIQSATA